jgi:hypothetical protein
MQVGNQRCVLLLLLECFGVMPHLLQHVLQRRQWVLLIWLRVHVAPRVCVQVLMLRVVLVMTNGGTRLKPGRPCVLLLLLLLLGSAIGATATC